MASINIFGPRLKIARAKRHIADFEHLIESFFSDNPYRIGFQERPDREGLQVIADFARPVPNDSATILGDVFHNFRSALDLLASEAIRAGGREATRQTGFPIFSSESTFESSVTRKLEGAPGIFVDYVRTLKPYRVSRNGTEGNTTLWALGQLNNDDKHNTLIPSVGVASLRNVMAVHEDGPEKGMMMIGEIRISGQGYAEGPSFGSRGMKLVAGGEASFYVALNHREFFRDEDIRSAIRRIENGVSEIVAEAGRLNV
jgi:hypothetical protein